jgi:hypothetical protein
VRTAEQTTIATAKEMDIVDCARPFALVSRASSDAIIAVMDARYTYNLSDTIGRGGMP